MEGAYPGPWVPAESFGGHPPNPLNSRADVGNPLWVQADKPKDLAALLGHLAEAVLALAQLLSTPGDELLKVLVQPLDTAPGKAELEQVDDLAGQNCEHLALLWREVVGRLIKHTQRPYVQPVRGDQRRTRIEANFLGAGNKRAVPEALVLERIRDFKHVV